MKPLRPVLMLTLLLTVLVSFSSCILIPVYKYHDDIDAETVSSIDIYDLRSTQIHHSGFLETEQPVYTLSEDQVDTFLADLAEIRFEDTIIIVLTPIDPSFNYGDWVVRINYTDGSYSLISSHGYGETFDQNNVKTDSDHYGCDDEEWEDLIRGYIPNELWEDNTQTSSSPQPSP